MVLEPQLGECITGSSFLLLQLRLLSQHFLSVHLLHERLVVEAELVEQLLSLLPAFHRLVGLLLDVVNQPLALIELALDEPLFLPQQCDLPLQLVSVALEVQFLLVHFLSQHR